MKTLHSFYTSSSIPHRCISESLQRLSPEELEIIPVNIYGRLFDFTARQKPKNVFMSICDYSQEVHDWINDHQSDINIFLLMDKSLGESNAELWNFICASKVKVIANSNLVDTIPPQFLSYENKYDSSVFYDRKMERNDKIAIMSNGDDKEKEKTEPLLYPNDTLKINIFNNPKWESPQNLGLLDPLQLSIVLNTFKCFLDFSSNLQLEAQACGITSIDINGDLKQAIVDNKVLPQVDKLDKRTYDYFTEHEILPYIRNNI